MTPGVGSALSKRQHCLVPRAGMAPLPQVWMEREPEGGLVNVQLVSKGLGWRGRVTDGKAQLGPGLTPDPRGSLTLLQAEPGPGLRPHLQLRLTCGPHRSFQIGPWPLQCPLRDSRSRAGTLSSRSP